METHEEKMRQFEGMIDSMFDDVAKGMEYADGSYFGLSQRVVDAAEHVFGEEL